MIKRRTFADHCHHGELLVAMRELFTVRRSGSFVDIPFHKVTAAECLELGQALHVLADQIAQHGEALAARPSNVVALNVWR
jgi:hypothetical protein